MNTSKYIDSLPKCLLFTFVNLQGFSNRIRRYSRAMRKQLHDWRKLETISIDEQLHRQVIGTKSILGVAANTSFYRKRFYEAGFDLNNFTSMEDLKLLPITTRSDVLEHFSSMIVPGKERSAVVRYTSGTTGKKLKFLQPKRLVFELAFAALYQAYAWHGVHPLSRRATLAGRYIGNRRNGLAVRNFAENQLLLSTHSLNRDSVRTYVDLLRKFRPKLLQAHPSALMLLKLLATEQDLGTLSIPIIAYTGENLVDPDREQIEHWLSGSVFGQYGSGEHHAAASECPAKHGFHLNPEFSYVELVESTVGNQIIGTSLLNDAMPLIRYQIGDIADNIACSRCVCGITWPRLQGLMGRSDDTVTRPDGQILAPVAIRTALSNRFRQIPSYTIIQRKNRGEFILRVFGRIGVDESEAVSAYLETLFGPGASVQVENVTDRSPLSDHAKHRTIIREL